MSPIHDQSYRRYAGVKEPPGRAWTVIAWAGIKGMLGRRAFLLLLVAAWIPFIVRAVQIYFVTAYPQVASFAPVNVDLFRQFVEQQGFFMFLVTIYVGAGLIANDRRANALQIYLSKPLLRTEYIAGKLAVLVVYLTAISFLPGLLLILLQLMFSGSFDFLRQHAYVVPAVTLASLVRVFVSAFTMLALSSLSKSGRYAAILYTGAIFFTEAVYGTLRVISGSSRVAWVSIGANLELVTDAAFRTALRYETPLLVSVLVLVGLVVVSISVLERRVRGVEVVA